MTGLIARHVGVFLGYAIATIGMTWPLAQRLGDGLARAPNWWDGYTNTMILANRVQGMTGEAGWGLWDNAFFAPIARTIVFNENLFGMALAWWPLAAVTDDPLWAYNVVLLLSVAAAGYAMWLLVRDVTGDGWAGLVAGVAWAFGPYVFFQLGRLQLVAIQWLPLVLFFLRRSLVERRLRDLIGLALVFLLQLGTCLYYAMFLLPVLCLGGGWWALTGARPSRSELARLVAVMIPTAVAAGLLVAPYLSSSRDLGLTRSFEYLETQGGELADLLRVYPDNRTMTPLHHQPDLNHGQEDISYPGAAILLLCLAAFLVPMARRRREGGWQLATLAVATGIAALGATWLSHTALAGLLVACLSGAWWHRRHSDQPVLPPGLAPWATMALLALVLFLGVSLGESGGERVRGLYDYLVAYVPGYANMRKVSRQGIVVLCLLGVVAGFGFRALGEVLRLVPARGARHAPAVVALVLAAATLFEFRNAPLAIADVPSTGSLPPIYDWLAEQHGAGPVTVMPARAGLRTFRGERGAAYANYLAAHHGKRITGGKSSWVPPITRRFEAELEAFPDSDALFFMRAVGVRWFVFHGLDVRASKRHAVEAWARRHTADVTERFRDGHDVAWEIEIPAGERPQRLRTTPEVPAGGRVLEIAGATASRGASDVGSAFDGRDDTRWTTYGAQREGDWLALDLGVPQPLRGIELRSGEHLFDAPRAWAVEVSADGETWREITRSPTPGLHSDQLFAPGRFVWRVVWTEGVTARHVRVRLLGGSSRVWWSVTEAVVYGAPGPGKGVR